MEGSRDPQSSIFHSRSSILRLLLSSAIGIVVSLKTYSIYEGFVHRADWLYWDPAAHALYGVRVAEAIRYLRPVSLLLTINEQTLWPPLHSLLQLPFQLGLGRGFYAASVTSFVFLALLFPALTYLYQQINNSWSGWITLMAFAASSPFYAGYGSMPMLEIFGAVFTAVAAALYLKNSRWFPLSLALLFFLKYNYCLYLLMPVIAIHAMEWRKTHSIRSELSRITAFGWFVAVYLFLMALILLTGGFKVGKISVRGIGNPLYVLFLIVLIRSFVTGRYRVFWQRIRGTGWEWFVIPVLVWLLIPVPNRVRTLVSFAINAPLGGQQPGELSYYTYYFDALSVYFAHPWLAWGCVAGAVISAIVFWKRRDVLFLSLLFAMPFLLMTLNQNKQERFLFTFVFALWVLCAEGVARLPKTFLRAVAACAIVAGSLYFYDIRAVHDHVAWPFVPLAVEAPALRIAEQASKASEVRILGTSNQMSPALLSYQILRITGFDRYPHLEWELEKNPPPGTLILRIE